MMPSSACAWASAASTSSQACQRFSMAIEGADAGIGDARRGRQRVASGAHWRTLLQSGRTSPSGSSTTLQSSSNTIVDALVGGVGRPVGLAGARERDPGLRHAVGQRLRAGLVVPLADHVERVEHERHFDRMAGLQACRRRPAISQAKSYIQTGALARAALRSASMIRAHGEVRHGERRDAAGRPGSPRDRGACSRRASSAAASPATAAMRLRSSSSLSVRFHTASSGARKIADSSLVPPTRIGMSSDTAGAAGSNGCAGSTLAVDHRAEIVAVEQGKRGPGQGRLRRRDGFLQTFERQGLQRRAGRR